MYEQQREITKTFSIDDGYYAHGHHRHHHDDVMGGEDTGKKS